MLEPEGRHLLLDSLRPPTGYVLDRAIGTTFSLDLAALLTAPVGFALLDRESSDGRTTTDPVALLESVRRNADRIDVFCQAGLIGLPAAYRPIVSYLESSIHEVVTPTPDAIFHPKVWLIRYRASDEVRDAAPGRRFRFLCLSRNLTFDRSWDTILRLEGEPVSERNPANEPLARFVRSLAAMARDPLPTQLVADLQELSDEVSHIAFEPPPGFDRYAFVPLGLDRRDRPWPFQTRVDRMLVISPFLMQGCLTRLERPRSHGRDVIISRPESFDAVGGAALTRFADAFTLSGDTTLPDAEADTDAIEPSATSVEDSATTESLAERPGVELRGLHAKLYVADQGHRATVWTGSANATDAAFGGNVEFLVELEGRKAHCGVDAVIGRSADGMTLRSLLESYVPSSEEPKPAGPIAVLERRLDVARRALASLRFTAHIVTPEGDVHQVRLVGEGAGKALRKVDWSGLEVLCRPLTVQEAFGRSVELTDAGLEVVFGALSFEALTSFFAFRIEGREDDVTASVSFLVNARLVGAPSDRRERILVNLLQNRSDLLRFLLFLLGGDHGGPQEIELGPDIWSMFGAADGEPKAAVPWQNVFEPMVRALARDPRQLDDIDRLVQDLRKTPEGQELLPPGWDTIWEPILGTRKGLVEQ